MNLRAIAVRLKSIAPLAHGLSKASWANVKSRFRAALSLVVPVLPGRSRVPLSSGWKHLQERIPIFGDRGRIGRFIHWLSARQIGPDDLKAEHLATFKDELFNDSLLSSPEKTWGAFAEAWNRNCKMVEGLATDLCGSPPTAGSLRDALVCLPAEV